MSSRSIGRIERQHHEGHVDIDEAEDDGGVIVEHLPWREWQAEKPEEPADRQIDIALGPEHRDQRIGADQQVDPEGQNHQEQQAEASNAAGAKQMPKAIG